MGFGNPSPGDIRPRQRHRDELITSRDCERDKSFGTCSPLAQRAQRRLFLRYRVIRWMPEQAMRSYLPS